jgi:hypothetical protein
MKNMLTATIQMEVETNGFADHDSVVTAFVESVLRQGVKTKQVVLHEGEKKRLRFT